jgi:hypothetical protein
MIFIVSLPLHSTHHTIDVLADAFIQEGLLLRCNNPTLAVVSSNADLLVEGQSMAGFHIMLSVLVGMQQSQ